MKLCIRCAFQTQGWGVSYVRQNVLIIESAARRLPLAPELSAEDRRSVDNVAIVMEFLLGSSSSAVVLEVAPLLPQVAAQMLPEVVTRLSSRISARALRDLYLSPVGGAQF